MKKRAYYFKKEIDSLLKATTPNEEVDATVALIKKYDKLLNTLAPEKEYTTENTTIINGGIALSSKHALDCLKDYLRTSRFLKGIYEAMIDHVQTFPTIKMEILYAGSGPAAPLVIPLLYLFEPEQLSVTVIDINKASIDSVKVIIDHLNLNTYFTNVLLTDATQYHHPEDESLHLIISETMDKGLIKEPQIQIMQNLAPQLSIGGTFIPEKISIFKERSFFAKENMFEISKDIDFKEKRINKSDREHLFSITKDIAAKPVFSYKSDTYKVPQDFTTLPDITVYAEVTIYKGEILHKNHSLLSNPVCIQSLHSVMGEQYYLTHTTEGIPNWKLTSI